MKLLKDTLTIEYDSQNQVLEIYDLWEENSQTKKAGYAQFSLSWLKEVEREEAFREIGQAILVRLESTRELLFENN